MAARSLRLEDLTAKGLASPLRKSLENPLSLGVSSLDDALPDAGLPTGAVVELCAPMGLGRLSHIALRACAAGQAHPSDWAAWIDHEEGSLFAPTLVHAGIDLERLLVVRPKPDDIARVAVRIATSRLFRTIVIDRCGLPGADTSTRKRWTTVVRRLALAAESSECTILLLSTTARAHRDLLPTAMRIELSRTHAKHLELNITKDRRGRLPGPATVPVTDLRWRAA